MTLALMKFMNYKEVSVKAGVCRCPVCKLEVTYLCVKSDLTPKVHSLPRFCPNKCKSEKHLKRKKEVLHNDVSKEDMGGDNPKPMNVVKIEV
jgi:hypothetical protein